jgi:hypothetical protein
VNDFLNRESSMATAPDLLKRHVETLVADPASWQGLIADDLKWETGLRPVPRAPGPAVRT